MVRTALFLALVGVASATMGFDANGNIDTAKMSCMKNVGYEFFIARVYRSNGLIDHSGIQNIINAHSAGIPYVDGYIFPCTSSSCATPANQISATVSALRNAGAKFGMLWLDIEVLSWSSDHTTNRNFIMAMANELDNLGINWGVYSNANNWEQIVGESWSALSHKPIWYARYNGKQSLTDGWIPFGGWTKPAIHQYSGDFTGTCGVQCDQNWY